MTRGKRAENEWPLAERCRVSEKVTVAIHICPDVCVCECVCAYRDWELRRRSHGGWSTGCWAVATKYERRNEEELRQTRDGQTMLKNELATSLNEKCFAHIVTKRKSQNSTTAVGKTIATYIFLPSLLRFTQWLGLYTQPVKSLNSSTLISSHHWRPYRCCVALEKRKPKML